MKRSLLNRPLWIRSGQFHPHLWDSDDYGLGHYPIMSKGNWMQRRADYRFKQWNHIHLSNRG